MAVADDRADLPRRRAFRPPGAVVRPLRPAPALNAVFAHGNAEVADRSGPDALVGRDGSRAGGAELARRAHRAARGAARRNLVVRPPLSEVERPRQDTGDGDRHAPGPDDAPGRPAVPLGAVPSEDEARGATDEKSGDGREEQPAQEGIAGRRRPVEPALQPGREGKAREGNEEDGQYPPRQRTSLAHAASPRLRPRGPRNGFSKSETASILTSLNPLA